MHELPSLSLPKSPELTARTNPATRTQRRGPSLQAFTALRQALRPGFRDWGAESTDAPRDICELALAHGNRDRLEAAYMRGDLFEHRRVLMQQWADYVAATA